jgi:hypothetical protein
VPEDERARLGQVLGEDEESLRLAVGQGASRLPLRAIYFLDRRTTGPARGVSIEELHPLEPRLLLAATFNFVIRSADRLANQLDVCSRIARRGRAFRLVSSPGASAAQASEAVLEHLEGIEDAT